jgi:small subunit ribosomal protein S20
MANHKSAIKRIRQTKTRNVKNRLQHKTTRNAIKILKDTTSKKEAEKLFTNVTSLLDKLAKNNVIHKNKSANLKSKLSKHVNGLKTVKKSKPKAKAKSS